MIVLLNVVNNNQLSGRENELIIITVNVVRLVFAKNWKNNNQYGGMV